MVHFSLKFEVKNNLVIFCFNKGLYVFVFGFHQFTTCTLLVYMCTCVHVHKQSYCGKKVCHCKKLRTVHGMFVIRYAIRN